MKEITISAISVFHPIVTKYGQAFARQENKAADSFGKGWKCWFPLGKLQNALTWEIGLVETDLHLPVIEWMESHPSRKEWIYALDTPIIQVVALSSSREKGRADAHTAQAILLQPGQSLLIHEGIWHAAGFPANLQHAIYGFALPPALPEVKEEGMVAFAEADTVRVKEGINLVQSQ